MSAPALKWLVATSLPCADRLAVAEVRLFIATHASPRALHVIANIFDGKPSRCRETLQLAAGNAAAEHPTREQVVLRITNVPGHKTVFWKKELTPGVVSRYDAIWLLDCDVRVTPHLFSIAEVEHWMHVTGASILQPSVVAQQEGGRSARGFARRGLASADCLAREVPYVEQMTPILRREAFEIFHQQALQQIPDEKLGSDSGIEVQNGRERVKRGGS